MSAAFGIDSVPNVNYGECLPCACDPIALSQQTAASSSTLSAANNHIAAVVITVQFISLLPTDIMQRILLSSHGPLRYLQVGML
jgi:hypothetical protein